MFKKKKCQRCARKINDDYEFCPHCGSSSNGTNQQDWGMLGKSDFRGMDDMKLPMGFNMIFKSLVKNLNKEFSKMDNERRGNVPKEGMERKGISISISTSGDKPPQIKVRHMGDGAPKVQKIKQQPEKKVLKEFTKDKLKKLKGLKKEEPSTNIRRFSDRVVYEIEVPDVKSIDDISIKKLENSIEIKALTKDKVYDKIIPINLPILNYELKEGRLVLELGDKG